MIIRSVDKFASIPTAARRKIINKIEVSQKSDLFFRIIQKAPIARKTSTIGQYPARIYGKPKQVVEVKRQIF
jgi:hypothetical protein